jgi:heme exporter protein A
VGNPSLITIENLRFERDDTTVVNCDHLHLDAGDILQVEGPNGSGKTTLLRLLTTALQPCEGTILYCGKSIIECRLEYLSDILFIGHQSAVKLSLTAEENLAWMAMSQLDSSSVLNALESLGLAGYTDIPCYKLSAGQKRRVALARLLISDARVWYLDEPFTAIDREGVKLLERCMKDHVSSGGAVVVSTHQDLDLKGVRHYPILGESLLRACS